MPYKKELAKKSNTDLSENRKSYYLTGRWESEDCEEYAMWFIADDDSQTKWDAHKAKITKEWNKQHPCARCWAWWEFDAPKEPIENWGDYIHRKRLGGIGDPEYKLLATAPLFEYGLPGSFLRQSDVDLYNGRQKDSDGKPWGDYKEGSFLGKAIDPEDPPTFESQAAYLQRHGFLSNTEKTYLAKHPEVLEPEKVEFENDKND